MRLLPYILGGMFLLGVLLFLLSLHQLRLRRTGAYWRMRRTRRGARRAAVHLLSVGADGRIGGAGGDHRAGDAGVQEVSRFLNRGPDDLYGIILPPDAR